MIIAILTVACLTAVLLVVTPIRSDNMRGGVADQLASLNANIATAQYDSGWINITNKCGQNITITRNLNGEDLIVDIQGKMGLDAQPHQKYLGLTGRTPGWQVTYISDYGDFYGQSVVQTRDGGFAILGYRLTGSQDWYRVRLIKTDSVGTCNGTKKSLHSLNVRSVWILFRLMMEDM